MEKANRIPEMFGCMVFGDSTMRERLPEEVYATLRRTIRRGAPLDLEVANPVADAMKTWAIERGATHYTHWFQPLTGITAEKHDSFIEPASRWPDHDAIFGQVACPWRIGRFFLPEWGSACNL